MPALRSCGVAVAVLFAHAGLARAEGPTIEHSAIKCLVAGKYRKMPARFAPPEVAQPRVYFRPEGVPSWYYVEMKPEAPLGHVGVLPKPTKKLVGQHVEYYVEAASRDFDTGRTPEYDPIVVSKDSECSNDPVPAFYAKEPPSAVFPSVPEGFAIGGGVAGGTVAAVVGGAAAAGAAVVVLSKGDDEPIPGTQPPVTNPPVTTPPVPPTTTQPPASPVDVSCQADPRQGPAPLQVKFNAQAAGGNGVFDYTWTFGDGDSSNQVNPSHTYATPGVYEARVVATSGGSAATCPRVITVLASSFHLDVSLLGTGLGRVTGQGIDCPGDCSEDYAPGTSVPLSLQLTGGTLFGGWGGDCSGTGTCTVTMDANRSVSATLIAPPPTLFPLSVTVGGNGSGTLTGSGISCPGTCSQSYPAGTQVALTATPSPTSFLGSWGGDCVGTKGLTCNLVMNGPRTASVTFIAATFRLTLNVQENANILAGVDVVPSPFGFCDSAPPPGTTCTADYTPGTSVTLRPVAETGDHLAWSGDCAGVAPTNSCVLAMTQDRTVGALFGQLTLVSGAPTLVSRVDAPSARVQATLNGAPLAQITTGVQTIAVSAVEGENRLEALLLDAAKGSWTLDLSGIPGLERGSLRVLSGHAVSVGPDAAVFKLSGRAGERIALAFAKR